MVVLPTARGGHRNTPHRGGQGNRCGVWFGVGAAAGAADFIAAGAAAGK